MANITTLHERRRGCGYRSPGGYYLMGGGAGSPCGRFPIPADRCPTCDEGLKQTRGFSWIDGKKIAESSSCKFEVDGERFPVAAYEGFCGACPLSPLHLNTLGREMDGRPNQVGLIWIGEKFYPTVEDFMAEAQQVGISRRVPKPPRGVKVGDWVFLGHPRTIAHPGDRENNPQADTTCSACETELLKAEKLDVPPGEMDCFVHFPRRANTAGLFYLFRVTTIDYVVKGDEKEEDLEKLEKRGVRLVNVVPVEDEDEEPVEDRIEVYPAQIATLKKIGVRLHEEGGRTFAYIVPGTDDLERIPDEEEVTP